MTPLDAMVAATANGAELLRIPDVGRVAEGMRADLVLYDGNPPRTSRSCGVPAPCGSQGRSWPDVRLGCREPRVVPAAAS